MSRNDITGDSLTSKASTDNYRDGHDRIWGKKCAHEWASDGDPGPGERMEFTCVLCGEKAVATPVAPYRCQFCGQPSWYAPEDQTPPPDYCHESDHGEPIK